jgi:hypothetical protein
MTQPYQLTPSPTTILRSQDGAFIPIDHSNNDYLTYQAWLAAGNTPDPVPSPSALQVANGQLAANDAMMFRALEVLIDVLLTKGTIVATDFPPAVRTMYLARKALRTTAGVP